MIPRHFGLRDNPFPALSDPESIFESSELIEVVQHFVFARENRDAILLVTGEVGTGKTTAIRAIRRTLTDDNPVAVLAFGTLTPEDLIGELESEFRVRRRKDDTRPKRLKRLAASFERSCKKGLWPVLILDEAHLLPEDTLDQIRLLTNLRFAGHPTVQVCLFGQSELGERLKEPRLRPLRQRISLRYEMRPLRPEETQAYLQARIRASGGEAPETVLTPAAAKAIHELSGGIPREINVVASQALMNAYVEGARTVQEPHVRTVSEHYGYEGADPSRIRSALLAAKRATPAENEGPSAPEVRAQMTSSATTIASRDTPGPGEAAPQAPTPKPRLGSFAIPGIGLVVIVLAVVVTVAKLAPNGQGRAERRELTESSEPTEEPSEKRVTEASSSVDATLTQSAASDEEEGGDEDQSVTTSPRDDEQQSPTGGSTPWSPARTASATSNRPTLAERYPGRLEVQSSEPALVWLDDKRLGEAPAVFSALAPGRYPLRVEADDGRVYRLEVQILMGSTTYVTASFP